MALEVPEGVVGDDAAPGGGAVDAPVVDTDRYEVGGEADIGFERISTQADRLAIGGLRVFGVFFAGASMGDDKGDGHWFRMSRSRVTLAAVDGRGRGARGAG